MPIPPAFTPILPLPSAFTQTNPLHHPQRPSHQLHHPRPLHPTLPLRHPPLSKMSPPKARTPSEIAKTLLKLARTNMTVISAVTYLAGAVLPTTPTHPFSPPLFLRGWLFILLTQFMTHFLGEVYDAATDRLNRHSTGLTGGSKATSPTTAPPLTLALIAGIISAILSLTTLHTIIPSPARPIGHAMIFLAWAYSAPPLKFNHRALGELDGALITSALVPYFAATVQGLVDGRFPWWNSNLSLLVVPPFFAKIALFIMLNLADRRPDWAAGKITIPVLFGPRVAARLHFLCMVLAYVSAVFLAVQNALHAPTVRAALSALSILLFVLPSAPFGLSLSKTILNNVPYRLDALLAPSLFHATLLVWGVVLHTMLRSIPTDGIFTFQSAFTALFAFVTLNNMLKGKRRAAAKAAAAFRQASHPKPTTASVLPAQKIASNGTLHRDVTIVGAGVSGLVAAAALAKMGRTVLVLERRPTATEAESGADLALWPGAMSILRELGVSLDFFDNDCFPLDRVYMCNMDFDKMKRGGSAAADTATILKTIDMAEVTHGTGERFVLVARQSLMDAIRAVVPEELIIYGANVRSVEEDEDNDCVTVHFNHESGSTLPKDFPKNKTSHSVTSRVVIGADGARSKLRAHVSPTYGGSESVRFCGEVCYRGVLSFSPDQAHVPAKHDTRMNDQLRKKMISLFPDKPSDCIMRINYGAGLRSSFGYMSADGNMSYWWVKVKTPEVPKNRGKMTECSWPEPLKTLHDVTPSSAFYMHPIEDSEPLPRWSTPRVVLVGDAAHVVTPNMGQGACLATEDAFVLATQLVKNWEYPDGQLEAFYDYEWIRKPYALTVLKEARKQLFLGQLSSKPAVFMRESLLKLIPTKILLKTLKKSNFPVWSYLKDFRQVAAETKAVVS